MENQYEKKLRHGACFLMTEWIQDGCRITPEEEAQQILRLVRRVCNREKAAPL